MSHSPACKVKNRLSPRETGYIDRADLDKYLQWKFGQAHNYGIEVLALPLVIYPF
jgi:hypothetical protein